MRKFRPHQFGMFRYARNTKHPFLHVEMRLGKCLVTIRTVKLYKPLNPSTGLKALVVAPNSALDGWTNDISLDTATPSPTNSIVNLAQAQTKKKRITLLQENFDNRDTHWFLLNKEGFVSFPLLLSSMDWDAVIIDEAFIRNPRAKVTKYFLKNFRDCPHRWFLSGLPAPENDMEYFGPLAWLDGQAFGCHSFWDWRVRDWQPSMLDQHAWVPKQGTKDKVLRTLSERCCVLRRKDAGVEPHKVKETRPVLFPPEIKRVYAKMELDFISASGDYETQWATTKYQWLWQLTGGFNENHQLVFDGKQKELLSLLKGELAKEKVVVWFVFNHEIDHTHATLAKQHIPSTFIYGSIPPEERTRRLNSWRSSSTIFCKSARVLLLQQAVAQTGMDLSASDTAIIYSQPPGQEAQRQTEDRIVSLSKKTTLLYLRLLVPGTVDEDIHVLGAGKHLKTELMHLAIRKRMEARSHAAY